MRNPENERYSFKLLPSEIADMLIEYFLNRVKQDVLAKKYGIKRCTVAYYVVLYRDKIIKFSEECQDKNGNIKIDCLKEKLLKAIMKRRFHRRASKTIKTETKKLYEQS